MKNLNTEKWYPQSVKWIFFLFSFTHSQYYSFLCDLFYHHHHTHRTQLWNMEREKYTHTQQRLYSPYNSGCLRQWLKTVSVKKTTKPQNQHEPPAAREHIIFITVLNTLGILFFSVAFEHFLLYFQYQLCVAY